MEQTHDRYYLRLAAIAAGLAHLLLIAMLLVGRNAAGEPVPVAVMEFIAYDPDDGWAGSGASAVESVGEATPAPVEEQPLEEDDQGPELSPVGPSVAEEAQPVPQKPAPAVRPPKPAPRLRNLPVVRSEPTRGSPLPPSTGENSAAEGVGGGAVEGSAGDTGKAWGGMRGGGYGSDNAMRVYASRIMRILDRNKRYPNAAKRRGNQGEPVVQFVLNRRGEVVRAWLVSRCACAELDEEALDLFRRVSPLPPIPDALEGETLTLRLPIMFTLR